MFLNIGTQERKVRIVAGFVLMAVGFAAPIPDLWHAASTTLGVASLLTASFGFCPFKALFLRSLS